MSQDQWTDIPNLEWVSEEKEWNDTIVILIFKAMAKFIAKTRNFYFVAKNRTRKFIANTRP